MEDIVIQTTDGLCLKATIFKANENCSKKCTLIINSATGISRKFYSNYSRYMSSHGFDVITYDYRGIAESRPPKLKGFTADFVMWGEKDFSSIIDKSKNLLPTNKIMVLGHSIGGTIFGMTPNCKEIEAVIMIGAQTAYYKDWPGKYRIKLYFLWHVFMPFVTNLVGYFPGKKLGMMEDIPKGVVRQWNDRRKNQSMATQLREKNVNLFYHTYNKKLMTIFIEDDFIGTERAVARVTELFTCADKQIMIVNPSKVSVNAIGHFGFFKKNLEGSLWHDTVNWYTQVLTTANRGTIINGG